MWACGLGSLTALETELLRFIYVFSADKSGYVENYTTFQDNLAMVYYRLIHYAR